jgi:DNA-binding XRE family transcriptional regulator
MPKKRSWQSPTPEQIKAHRLQLDIEQDEYAAMLCVTPVTVSRWENGHRSMHAGLWKLACMLGDKILAERERRASRKSAPK